MSDPLFALANMRGHASFAKATFEWLDELIDYANQHKLDCTSTIQALIRAPLRVGTREVVFFREQRESYSGGQAPTIHVAGEILSCDTSKSSGLILYESSVFRPLGSKWERVASETSIWKQTLFGANKPVPKTSDAWVRALEAFNKIPTGPEW